MSRTKFNIISYLSAVFLIILDQLTKIWAIKFLSDTGDGSHDISIIDKVFRLHYLENQGAAFGIMQGKQIFFIVLTLLVVFFIFYFYNKIPIEKKFFSLDTCIIFLLAGALGNLYDRVFRTYVVDFFYFELIDFPVFNVADIYVTCSVIVLVLLILFKYKEEDISRIFPDKGEKKA